MSGAWRMIAAMGLIAGLTCCTTAHAARAPGKSPEIFAIDPGEGPAGTIIKVTGNGFERTRYVLFAAGRTGQQAKFKVVSDRQLEVTAPPYLREGTSATVVVVTERGAAVGLPPSVLELDQRQGKGKAATFYLVRNGGMLGASQGVVVVDEGGQATASESSAICFVKNGGTLQQADRFAGLIIHEPEVTLQTSPHPYNPATRLMQVPVITTSPGIEPFVYQRPGAPETRAETPPEVSSVSPRIVPNAGIVTLQGIGFSETSEVLVLVGENENKVTAADFQIVSDKELSVQVPEQVSGGARLVVINPKGATLVVARSDLAVRPAPVSRATVPRAKAPSHAARVKSVSRVRTSAYPVTHVNDKVLVNDSGQRGMYFVEAGGRVVDAVGSGVYFVKKGGHLEGAGGRTFIVHEPLADVSLDGGRQAPGTNREVESVSLSVVPATLEIVAP